jgi:hypothetical protein
MGGAGRWRWGWKALGGASTLEALPHPNPNHPTTLEALPDSNPNPATLEALRQACTWAFLTPPAEILPRNPRGRSWWRVAAAACIYLNVAHNLKTLPEATL